MIVLDASAVVELVLSTPTGHQVALRLRSLIAPVHAPHLLGVEVAHAMRRLAAAGTVTEHDGRRALEVLTQLEIRRWEHEPLLRRAWQLRDNVTAYDAMYVALAEALDVPLLTTDVRLSRSTGHNARVEVVRA